MGRHRGLFMTTRLLALMWVALTLLSCGGSSGSARRGQPTTGAIAGLARDQDSGDPVGAARIRLRATGELTQPRSTTTSDRGLYDLDALPPGTYSLIAEFAEQSIEVVNIPVEAGEMTMVDLTFVLGRVGPIRIDYSAPEPPAITRYRPSDVKANVARIEGTVSETVTKRRVEGAVVTLIGPLGPEYSEQAVTDPSGRFRFDGAIPGEYTVSASYTVANRALIEVRRSNIVVVAGEAASVPMWIDTTR